MRVRKWVAASDNNTARVWAGRGAESVGAAEHTAATCPSVSDTVRGTERRGGGDT